MQINISLNEEFDDHDSVLELALNIIEETCNNGFAVDNIIINNEEIFNLKTGFASKFLNKER